MGEFNEPLRRQHCMIVASNSRKICEITPDLQALGDRVVSLVNSFDGVPTEVLDNPDVKKYIAGVLQHTLLCICAAHKRGERIDPKYQPNPVDWESCRESWAGEY